MFTATSSFIFSTRILKLESTQNDQSPCQLWLFFAKISFKPPFEGYFEHYAVSKPGID